MTLLSFCKIEPSSLYIKVIVKILAASSYPEEEE